MAESLGEDKWMCCLINCLATYAFGHWGFAGHNTYLREKMRSQKGYEGSLAKDFLLSFFCDICVLTQQIREIRDDPGVQKMERQ